MVTLGRSLRWRVHRPGLPPTMFRMASRFASQRHLRIRPTARCNHNVEIATEGCSNGWPGFAPYAPMPSQLCFSIWAKSMERCILRPCGGRFLRDHMSWAKGAFPQKSRGDFSVQSAEACALRGIAFEVKGFYQNSVREAGALCSEAAARSVASMTVALTRQ